MDAKDKLVRARIQIQNRNPFFAYLSLFLKFKEAKKEDLRGNGIGVDNKGNVYYEPKWIEKLTDEELIGVLIHEIMHLSFLHLLRMGKRNMLKWNIATDIAVNQIILDNGFTLPDCGLKPEYNEIKIGDLKIKKIREKSAEIIYDELINIPETEEKKYRFDNHIHNDNTDDEEQKKSENEWLGRVEEAYVSAKMRGNVPGSIEKLIGNLHKSEISWKSILKKYIVNYIPYDYTYSKPNKKSISAGYYMPDYSKEKVKIVIAIDTSGSIGKNEVQDFLSEIIGMSKTYKNRIDMRLLCHDVDITSDLEIRNGNIDKIKNLKLLGGGGTSHKLVFDYVKEKISDTKAVVFLTDGYSDINEINMNNYRFGKIFVISKDGTDSFGNNQIQKIKLKENF